ncbi:hypothetical protein GGR58DRAFT_476546 [Xylaria digitata]|nr:hypothetical protein GGR58DRAFT_476546 [Xylaria digitata]
MKQYDPRRVFSKELISRLICREELGLHSMIRKIPLAKPSSIRCEPLRPSPGSLNRLPAEILLLTLDLLPVVARAARSLLSEFDCVCGTMLLTISNIATA